MHRKIMILSLLIGALLLSGCGGDDAPKATTVPTVTPTPTEASILAAIPTWTPVPSSTVAPPRATIEIDYSRPTDTPFSVIGNPTAVPQRTATSAPVVTAATGPTAAAPTVVVATQAVPVGTINPTLVIPVQALNAAVSAALASNPIEGIAGQPSITVRNGQLFVQGMVVAVTESGTVEIPVAARVNVLQLQGQPTLSVEEAYFTGDSSPYEGDLTGAYLNIVEDELVRLVESQYFTIRPDDSGYFVATITVKSPDITFQTVSIPE